MKSFGFAGLIGSLARRRVLTLAIPALALLWPASAAANMIPVDTTSDAQYLAGNDCSLREAIRAANVDIANVNCPTGNGVDVILVPPGTYELEQVGAENDVQHVEAFEDLDVTTEMTIMNTGGGRVIIDANGLSRVFDLATGGAGATLTGLTIQDGKETFGGGIRSSFGPTKIENSTISGNEATAGRGGGIYSAGTGADLGLVNVTISGNKASEGAGGLALSAGSAVLTAVTITGNTADSDAGGVGGDGGGISAVVPATLRGSLIAGNSDASPGAEAPDCEDSATPPAHNITSAGNNLIGSTTGCNYAAGAGDVLNQPANLGPLADNGGDTFTHALLAGSSAINRGSSETPDTDQRGLPRQGRADIGAYEFHGCGGLAATLLGTNGKDTLVGTPQVDAIVAFSGNDVIRGRSGADKVCAGGGRDQVRGGGGRDLLRGEAGKDRLFGQAGRDRLIGGPGRDFLRGGRGRDVLRGGPGRDNQKQ